MDGAIKNGVEARYQFKDREFCLLMSIENNEILIVQAEDESSGDQWLGRFDSNYIEQLTHKTGNFKEFSIFCSMLESGLKKTSESIMLELMAYSDLDSLRSEKSGTKQQKRTSTTKFHNRRYLIMTYTVEFDRIHYPLSLNYIGKIDLSSLKKLVKKQRVEITELRWKLQNALKLSKGEGQDNLSVDRLLQEKEALLSELDACKQTLSSRTVAKELRILKKVIRSLESDLLKEKSRNQRLVSKKTDECKQLAEELENVKSSERNLRVRVKNLLEEISILKRSAQMSPSTRFYSDQCLRKSDKPTEKTIRRNSSIERRRYTTPSPAEKRRRQQELETSKERTKSSSRLGRRSKSNSVERHTPIAKSHSRSSSRNMPTDIKYRRSSSRDSTGRDIANKMNNVFCTVGDQLSKGIPDTNSSLLEGAFRHSRNSSATSIGSRQSLADSGSERVLTKPTNNLRSAVNRGKSSSHSLPGKRSRKTISHGALSSGESDVESIPYWKNEMFASKENRINRAPNEKRIYIKNGSGDENEMENSLDIAEIDARLTALQKFMKSNIDEL